MQSSGEVLLLEDRVDGYGGGHCSWLSWDVERGNLESEYSNLVEGHYTVRFTGSINIRVSNPSWDAGIDTDGRFFASVFYGPLRRKLTIGYERD